MPRVESVGVVYEVLQMLEGKRGCKRGAAQGLQQPVERVRPEADGDVVVGGDDP